MSWEDIDHAFDVWKANVYTNFQQISLQLIELELELARVREKRYTKGFTRIIQADQPMILLNWDICLCCFCPAVPAQIRLNSSRQQAVQEQMKAFQAPLWKMTE